MNENSLTKFNISKNKKSKSESETLVRNYEGGIAYTLSPVLELYTRICTYLVREPKFYGEVADEEKQILDLIAKVSEIDPLFIFQLAVYARNTLHLRSAPIMLLGEAALNNNCKKTFTETNGWKGNPLRLFTPKIIKRADELTEIISYIKSKIGDIGDKAPKGSLPSGLKRGLAEAMHNFDQYQYSKYDRASSSKSKSVSMRDVIRLVHPFPRTEEEKQLFKLIATDSLPPADTWEVLISTKGSSNETWKEALYKMPYMALLRNLRNLLDNGIGENEKEIQYIISELTSREKVLNSKQFPFRFISAYREIEDNSHTSTSRILDALNDAIEISISNIPKTDGITAIFSDNSASMCSPISKMSKIQMIEVGAILSAIANKTSQTSVTGVFGEEFKMVNLSSRDGILSNAEKLVRTDVGHSTNAYLTLDYLNRYNVKVDRILLFSDMQCYDDTYDGDSYNFVQNSLNRYKENVNPNVYFYSFDLAGYGTIQTPENAPRTCLVSGWSESILKYIPVFESDSKTAIDEIKKIL